MREGLWKEKWCVGGSVRDRGDDNLPRILRSFTKRSGSPVVVHSDCPNPTYALHWQTQLPPDSQNKTDPKWLSVLAHSGLLMQGNFTPPKETDQEKARREQFEERRRANKFAQPPPQTTNERLREAADAFYEPRGSGASRPEALSNLHHAVACNSYDEPENLTQRQQRAKAHWVRLYSMRFFVSNYTQRVGSFSCSPQGPLPTQTLTFRLKQTTRCHARRARTAQNNNGLNRV